ncbi:MAG: glutathione S-transferase N-terminal domain-containing protein [Candidatus Wildermuthbacteria bacterium]|nr:glutathione S-transferase N-terminal domain-containing protein [Candidatus Wildermuthbacteria bacterium]
MPNVIIYTTPSCVYCRTAKEFFKDHTIAYEEKDVVKDIDARNEMVKKAGQLAVPVIDVGGEIVIGFDRTKLSKLLGI